VINAVIPTPIIADDLIQNKNSTEDKEPALVAGSFLVFGVIDALIFSARPELVEGQSAHRCGLRSFDFAQDQPERLRINQRNADLCAFVPLHNTFLFAFAPKIPELLQGNMV